MIQTELDGMPVRLRAPHDLSFTARWGRVFAVLDQQDSGNLCGVRWPSVAALAEAWRTVPTVPPEGPE